jgi:lysophospholipase L1-like esterase
MPEAGGETMRNRTLWLLFLFLVAAAPAHGETPSDICKTRLDRLVGYPIPAARPAMMAIGDSLYNGVTSLTIDRARAERSAPALVARALSIADFQVPRYPMPILLDVERELRRTLVGVTDTIGPEIADNIAWWVDSYPREAAAQPEWFDNISVAQADSVQLMCDMAARAEYWLAHGSVHAGILDVPEAIGSWYYELNSRFLLDPRLSKAQAGRATRDRLSQLAQVMLRQPERLLINIGANDGVWLMAFDGYAPNRPYQFCTFETSDGTDSGCRRTTVEREMDDLVENMRLIAHYLPASIAHVYVNNLGPPSRVANLIPLPYAVPMECANDPAHPDRKSVYFSGYVTYVSDQSPATITGEQACAMDRQVNRTNAAIEAAMRAVLGDRVAIVDMNGLLMRMDGKHLGPGHGVTVTLDVAGRQQVELDNRVVRPQTLFGDLSSGGLFGYDNMHLTFVGYALMAKQVAKTIAAHEPGVAIDWRVFDAQPIVDAVEASGDASALKTAALDDLNIWFGRLALEFVAATPPDRPRVRARNAPLPRLFSLMGRQGTTAEEP